MDLKGLFRFTSLQVVSRLDNHPITILHFTSNSNLFLKPLIQALTPKLAHPLNKTTFLYLPTQEAGRWSGEVQHRPLASAGAGGPHIGTSTT